MIDERRLRVSQAIKESGANWAILTTHDAVCYASDHEVPFETGPFPSAGGPTCAFVGTDGTLGLVVVNAEEKAAQAANVSLVRAYEGYSYLHQAPAKDNFLRTALSVASEMGVGGVIAIEPVNFPASLHEALKELGRTFVDITPALRQARATKTALELERLRYAAELTAVGQQAALEKSAPGRRELEVLADIRYAMELRHTRRLPLINDFVTGVAGTAQMTGPTSPRAILEGDPIICDLAPRVAGYWGDSCNTFVVGEPTPKFLELYDLERRALEHAISILRPGITAGNFDSEVRGMIRAAGFEYAHHTGHGIGTAVHEFPMLVPEETAVLREDMVLLVEPGVYAPGIGGIRLEWMFRLTANGNEVLSPFKHVLQPPRYQQAFARGGQPA